MNQIFRYALIMVVSLFAICANGAPVAYSVNSDSGSREQVDKRILHKRHHAIEIEELIEDLYRYLRAVVQIGEQKDVRSVAAEPAFWRVRSKASFVNVRHFGSSTGSLLLSYALSCTLH